MQIAEHSYQREGATDQNYKYQGQERQFDFDLDWDMFRFRTHDPAIARFLQVDPLSDDYVYNSPYAFAENKLGLGTELEGAELNLFPWLAADAVVNPSGVGAHSLGILKGLENNVTGLIDAVTHPIETAKGLGNLALLGASQGNAATSIAIDNALGTNSFETGAALGNAIEQGVDNLISGDGLERGEVIGEIAGAVIGAKGTTAATKAVSTAIKANKTVKVFRGVNQSHPGFQNALDGKVIPRGGKANPVQHNLGNTKSNFTSWTTDVRVAQNYALRPRGSGVVLQKNVPTKRLVNSPSIKNVNLKQSPGTVVNESEVLIRGPVSGAQVIIVK